jgi:hypothetical protein
MPVHIVAAGSKVVRPLHGQHEIRLAETPAGLELRRSRQCGRVALERALAHPLLHERDLIAREPARADELTGTGLGLPRRHVSPRDRVCDQLRTALCICICEEAERGAVRPVARRAVAKNQRRNVARERHAPRLRRRRPDEAWSANQKNDQRSPDVVSGFSRTGRVTPRQTH